jgi:hypothetical protein
VICLLISITACSNESKRSGQVVAYGGDSTFFELDCEDGNNYGYVITEDTELIWQDKSAFSMWGENIDEWYVFGRNMYVTVEGNQKTESADEYVDECVEGWYVAETITVTGVDEIYFRVDAKPVIYLYPEEKTKVQVKLDYSGKLTCTYPKYENGWEVIAQEDGTLLDANSQAYNYLYWEGINAIEYDFSRGFCVKGEDTATFLEKSLEALGLSRKEANEFIVYWLPQLECNSYNLISFQSENYTDSAKLEITPKPNTMIRVFMAWMPLEEAVQIESQILTSTERKGFTVVEWGGTKVNIGEVK